MNGPRGACLISFFLILPDINLGPAVAQEVRASAARRRDLRRQAHGVDAGKGS